LDFLAVRRQPAFQRQKNKIDMDGRSANQAAVEAALPAVASVLCSLIVDYLPQRHVWNLHRPIRVVGRSDPYAANRLRTACGIANKNGQTNIVHRDTDNFRFPAYKLVSNGDMRSAAWHWKVGIDRRSEYGCYFGAGVTTSSDNTVFQMDELQPLSTKNDWSVMYTSRAVYHDKRSCAVQPVSIEYFRTSFQSDVSEMYGYDDYAEFVADKASLRILVRIDDDGADRCFVLMTAKTLDEFYSLRPCVFVGGMVNASVVYAD
jgi:hypothetical protein